VNAHSAQKSHQEEKKKKGGRTLSLLGWIQVKAKVGKRDPKKRPSLGGGCETEESDGVSNQGEERDSEAPVWGAAGPV